MLIVEKKIKLYMLHKVTNITENIPFLNKGGVLTFLDKIKKTKEKIMNKHPFGPFIVENSKKAIIGTLPPENIDFYYSNNSNNRMWDILTAIANNDTELPKNNFCMPKPEKEDILKKLKLSMFDIVEVYERKSNTTKDTDIIPKEFLDINEIIKNTQIENLFFVYKQAARWFLQSNKIKNINMINDLKSITEGEFCNYDSNDKKIKCFILPNPLNRGQKGMTILKKFEIYKKYLNS